MPTNHAIANPRTDAELFAVFWLEPVPYDTLIYGCRSYYWACRGVDLGGAVRTLRDQRLEAVRATARRLQHEHAERRRRALTGALSVPSPSVGALSLSTRTDDLPF